MLQATSTGNFPPWEIDAFDLPDSIGFYQDKLALEKLMHVIETTTKAWTGFL